MNAAAAPSVAPWGASFLEEQLSGQALWVGGGTEAGLHWPRAYGRREEIPGCLHPGPLGHSWAFEEGVFCVGGAWAQELGVSLWRGEACPRRTFLPSRLQFLT